MQKPVLTKADFVRRYKAGEFGNASPTWSTVVEYQQSGYLGSVHLRNRVASAPGAYNVTPKTFTAELLGLYDKGVKNEDLYVSAMAPHHLNIIQGEVQRSGRHLDLFYSNEPDLPMRDALAKCAHQVYGATARFLLRFYLNQRSYEWLEYLLCSYPDHVVEFSVFQKCWGTVPGHNTVFWEVRAY